MSSKFFKASHSVVKIVYLEISFVRCLAGGALCVKPWWRPVPLDGCAFLSLMQLGNSVTLLCQQRRLQLCPAMENVLDCKSVDPKLKSLHFNLVQIVLTCFAADVIACESWLSLKAHCWQVGHQMQTHFSFSSAKASHKPASHYWWFLIGSPNQVSAFSCQTKMLTNTETETARHMTKLRRIPPCKCKQKLDMFGAHTCFMKAIIKTLRHLWSNQVFFFRLFLPLRVLLDVCYEAAPDNVAYFWTVISCK